VEIILTGSFLLRIFEMKYWNFNKVRLWTFSSKVRDFFIHYVGIEEKYIGLIGRSISKNNIASANFQDPVINLVYAGRLSPAKNITTLLKLTHQLQDHGLNVTLDIYGDYNLLPNEAFGRYTPIPIRQLIDELIYSRKWTTVPKFHGTVPQGQWIQHEYKNPVFISLSTSMYEDFGTACHIA